MHGNTGLVLEYDNNSVLSKLLYEPFTQTSYLIRQELAIPSLSSTGEYTVAIYDGHLQSDGLREYVLAIGEREDFGPIDFFTTLPAAWFETKLYFQDYLSIAVAIAVIASAIIIILISTIIFRKRITARLQARAKLSRRHGIH